MNNLAKVNVTVMMPMLTVTLDELRVRLGCDVKLAEWHIYENKVVLVQDPKKLSCCYFGDSWPVKLVVVEDEENTVTAVLEVEKIMAREVKSSRHERKSSRRQAEEK